MGKGIQEGYDAIQNKNEEIRKRQDEERKNRVPMLFLPKGGFARIRFLSGPITYNAHKIWDPVKKKNLVRYCTIDDDVDEICQYCSNGIKIKRQFMFWVYVYFKLQEVKGTFGEWEEVNFRNKRYWRQVVERPMTLRMSVGKSNAMLEKFTNCYLEHDNSWFDRDYTFNRNDEKEWNKTDYFLTSRDPSEYTARLKKIASLLPKLAEVAEGKIELALPNFDANGDPVKEEPKGEKKDDGKKEEAPKKDAPVIDDEGSTPAAAKPVDDKPITKKGKKSEAKKEDLPPGVTVDVTKDPTIAEEEDGEEGSGSGPGSDWD